MITSRDHEPTADRAAPPGNIEELSFELSSRRTGLSLQRTRMSADRTLMSTIRTALSLIGFGFTIFQFFRYVATSAGIKGELPHHEARNFGMALVLLGIGTLVMGIVSHIDFARQLRAERNMLIDQRLIHGKLSFPVSRTFIAAGLLLVIGLIAVIGMVLGSGPVA